MARACPASAPPGSVLAPLRPRPLSAHLGLGAVLRP